MSTHSIWKFCLVGLGACVLIVSMAQPAQAQQGVAERIGEQLDRGIDRFSEEFREGWESFRQSVDRMGVRGRVYSRLHWDKQLTDAEIDIEVEEGGVVALRGQVASAAAKEKAAQLTGDTVGVTRVVDDLTVETPAEESEL